MDVLAVQDAYNDDHRVRSPAERDTWPPAN